jgi:hypothetical protein
LKKGRKIVREKNYGEKVRGGGETRKKIGGKKVREKKKEKKHTGK